MRGEYEMTKEVTYKDLIGMLADNYEKSKSRL